MLALACALGACAHAPAPEAGYALFGGQPVPFRPVSGKVVGVYVPNWESPALLDAVPAGNVTHVLYAFLHICGPGQLSTDDAACRGRRDFELATGPLEDEFDAAFARLKARAPRVQVIASIGGWGPAIAGRSTSTSMPFATSSAAFRPLKPRDNVSCRLWRSRWACRPRTPSTRS